MELEPARLPISINEAEAIIDPFWDEKISALNQYSVNKHTAAGIPPQCNPRSVQYWCWDMLKWDHAPVGRPIITLERALNVDIRDYDRIIVHLASPAHVSLDLTVVIDGEQRQLISGSPGHDGPHEYEAAISGERLQGLTLALTSGRDQADEAWLYWIGVANEGRRTAMLAQPSPFDERWHPWLLPPQATPDFKPRFGFYFDAADLPAIRRRAASPAYKPLMDELRQRAHAAMAFHKSPEQQVGPYLGAGEAWHIQTRERDWDTFPFFTQAPLVAFVGLVDQNAEMLRFAARMAVATAHCRSWVPHFMQDFPGSTWDTRAFSEACASAGVALALDWAGSWFTDAGEHLIRYALTNKGLGRVRGTYLQYDYMWDCNQAHHNTPGRLLALLVQLGHAGEPDPASGVTSAAMAGRTPETKAGWERVRADIDQFERDVYEIIDRYVQPDGSTNEGLTYWSTTFRCTLPVLAALARYRGKPVSEMIPPKLRLMWNFIAPMLSTASEPGTFLTIADASANYMSFDPITMGAVLLGGPGWTGLLGACLGGGKKSIIRSEFDFMTDGPMTLIFGPDEPAAPSIEVPVFRKLETAGMITSNRPWNPSPSIGGDAGGQMLPPSIGGDAGGRVPSPSVGGAGGGRTVRLHLVGAMPKAGHCHPDKGSFIIEACGEVFAGDRGLMVYVDPLCRTLSAEIAHNLAVAEDTFQTNPSPAGALWHGEGDAQYLSAEIDASATWQAPVRVARRRITSPRPDLIEIEDEIELDEARPVTFYLHTPLPVSAGGTTATVQGTKARMTVEAGWAIGSSAGEYYCDWDYKPYNRITMTAAAAKRHLLKTVLRFEPRVSA